MKITIVYNLDPNEDKNDLDNLVADDAVATAQEIAQALAKKGHQTSLFNLTYETVQDLSELKPDVFVNQAWGIGGDENSEDKVAQLLENTKIPYTGADAAAILLTSSKAKTKEVLIKANLPTAKYLVSDQVQIFSNFKLSFPAIVKPEDQDCSLGITQSSVCNNLSEINRQIEYIAKKYHSRSLIEEYIAGRELNVTVLGNGQNIKALPISEIVFGPSFTNKYRLVDFDSKWQVQSDSYRETTGVCPADLPPETTHLVQNLAINAFIATGSRDYARVDFRLNSKLEPFILEVNSNPGIGQNDGAVRSAKAAGLSYGDFLQQLVNFALTRR